MDASGKKDFEIICGDSLKILPSLPAESFDACVTDPPYELGFMGAGWDKTGIANSAELWRGVFRALKPGAHLVAFSGTRTYHRMACAIEYALKFSGQNELSAAARGQEELF